MPTTSADQSLNERLSEQLKRHRSDLTSLVPDKEHRDYIDSRIRDIEGAAARSRWIYGLSMILAWLLIAMAFNSMLSWTRATAERSEARQHSLTGAQLQSTAGADGISRSSSRSSLPINDTLSRYWLRNWVESLHFDVPFIGARFGASDAGIVGGTLLLLLGLWCFYSARRENHLIFYLLRDCVRYATNQAFRRYVRNQLHATQIFLATNTNHPLNADQLLSRRSKASFKPAGTLARVMLLALFFLPPIALVIVFITDVATLFANSPFRAGVDDLWCALARDAVQGARAPGDVLSCDTALAKAFLRSADGLALLARLTTSLILCIASLVVMWKAYEFQRATRMLLGIVDQREWGAPP